jgi:hypothetical protein
MAWTDYVFLVNKSSAEDRVVLNVLGRSDLASVLIRYVIRQVANK